MKWLSKSASAPTPASRPPAWVTIATLAETPLVRMVTAIACRAIPETPDESFAELAARRDATRVVSLKR